MEYDRHVKNHLKRIAGQVKGVLNMMEQGENYREIVTQLSAANSALNREIGVMVSTNLEQCARESVKQDGKTENLVKEAIDLLVKSR
ncbi:metal-sensing transcriptional repressor [Brevibacterium sp. PAMC23299]|uniref:metal-sensing transcriptional repressor n=1 Tax=Peribacillus frigoritolerans TaxID=450367 RepID=UPI00164E544C|nr:metal-sensing transcriptional repressor [Peribacillus frigoritolerans]MEB2494687.1 metal-sensing transcriptional repressor [Peribacillus frigoritolerans]QNK47544.1 metal-sensing transcriptional repressor [Brevibacterium sp. PAMC23299]